MHGKVHHEKKPVSREAGVGKAKKNADRETGNSVRFI